MTNLNTALLIGDAWTPGLGEALSSTDPADGSPVWQGTMATPTQADLAVEAAHTAFLDWRKTPMEERVEIAEKFSAIAANRKEEMATLIAREMGKALWDARTEAGAVAGKLGLSLKAYDERTPTRTDGAAQLRHRPHGVMAVIGPFNFPAHLPNGHIIPALIAGNTIVFKPSEQTPAVGILMAQWWEEAGLPPGVLNLVHGGVDVATAIIQHEKTRGVLFTGGVPAGLAIHRSLAGHPDKILALELGGNNPLVAWDVADVEGAARIVARSAYITTGQRCTCSRRLIVPEGKGGDPIIEAVTALIPRLKVGPALSSDEPFMGSLVNREAATSVLAAQDAMTSSGAVSIVSATRTDDGDAFLHPGLIDTSNWSARVDDEVFGPILQVIRVPSFEVAIETANATRFGLAAGLLTDNEAHWDTFRTQIHAGIVNWNRQTTGASGAAPFGGPGLSGNHRPAGYYAADYCAWPMASMVAPGPLKDDAAMPGLLS